jgi:hypothetical protein
VKERAPYNHAVITMGDVIHPVQLARTHPRARAAATEFEIGPCEKAPIGTERSYSDPLESVTENPKERERSICLAYKYNMWVK